jgi:hypothetical protein
LNGRPSAGRAKEFVEALKIQPEFCARAKEVSGAQGRIAGNGPLTIQNPGDAVGWDGQLTRQLGRAHAEFFQFFGQVFS